MFIRIQNIFTIIYRDFPCHNRPLRFCSSTKSRNIRSLRVDLLVLFPHKKRRLSKFDKATTTTTTTTTKHEISPGALISLNVVACEYSRLSLPREVSVIRSEKFHTDDVNLPRIASDGMTDSVNRQLTVEGFKHCVRELCPK